MRLFLVMARPRQRRQLSQLWDSFLLPFRKTYDLCVCCSLFLCLFFLENYLRFPNLNLKERSFTITR